MRREHNTFNTTIQQAGTLAKPGQVEFIFLYQGFRIIPGPTCFFRRLQMNVHLMVARSSVVHQDEKNN